MRYGAPGNSKSSFSIAGAAARATFRERLAEKLRQHVWGSPAVSQKIHGIF
jgi:hypothetical protein